MSHASYEELLPAYLDGELAEAERHVVRDHLAACPDCRALLRNLRRLNSLTVQRPAVPPSMRSRLRRVDANVARHIHARRRPALGAQILSSGWRATAATVPYALMGVIALLMVLLGGPVLRARLSPKTAHLAAPAATRTASPSVADKTTSFPNLVSASAAQTFAAASTTPVRGDFVTSAASSRGLAATIRTLPAPIISLAPDGDSTIYALLATDALYRSDDSGASWQLLPLPLREHTAAPAAPAGESSLYLASPSGVAVPSGQRGRVFVAAAHVLYRSDDRGASWASVHDSVGSWAIADAAGNDLYVWHDPTTSAARGLYRSTDAGRTWAQAYVGAFPPTPSGEHCPCSREGILALAVDPRSPQTLYAGSDFGVYRSAGGGKTWAALDQDLPATVLPYRSTPLLAVAGDGTVYAVSEIWTSPTVSRAALLRLSPGESAWTDVGGATFAALQDAGQPFHGINALVVDPTRPERLYLGTSGGLATSDDGGATWRSVKLPSGHAVYRVAVDTENADHDGKINPALILSTDVGFVRVVPAP